MKDYEKINYLKHKVMEASAKWGKWNAYRGQAETNLKNFDIYTAEQRKAFVEDLKHTEDTLAQTFEFLQEAQKNLKDAETSIDAKREKKVRKAPVKKDKEIDIKEEEIEILKEVKAQVNGKFAELLDGKERCPECGELFKKGGAFYNHYKSHFNGD